MKYSELRLYCFTTPPRSDGQGCIPYTQQGQQAFAIEYLITIVIYVL
jgi:hypothetical protein